MSNPSQLVLPADLSVRTLLRWVSDCLTDAGVASPAAEARLLLAAVVPCEPSQLILQSDSPLNCAQGETLRAWVARRMTREPLQHILGEAPFCDFVVAVGEGVFIPRPETELLAEWGISAARSAQCSSRQRTSGEKRNEECPPLRILDLCAGSGVLAIALARALPTAEIWAVEYSMPALRYLHRNVDTLAPQVTVVAGNAALPYDSWGIPSNSVDLVVCNPPYVPSGSSVDRETAESDPTDAVFSGTDGLALSRKILRHLPFLLSPGARVGIEHDDVTGDALCQEAALAGYSDCRDHCDLTGRPRFVTASWRPNGRPPGRIVA